MADHAETKTAEIPSSAAKPSGTATVPASKPPSKPGAEKAGADAPPDRMRRRVIWAAIGGYLGINFLMFLRFFFPRALYEPNTVFSIGFPADFALGVNQQFLNTNRVWVIKEPDRLFVVFARCTHLGCTPEWKPSENKFKCPCHGSGYDAEAINFEGPAPRPMDRAHVEVDATGKTMVDTSRLYVDDPNAGVNHFNDPGAFISL
jgi:cytochrome b6-f complex iron-sulfur subunit